jgi:hypothetical protein
MVDAQISEVDTNLYQLTWGHAILYADNLQKMSNS